MYQKLYAMDNQVYRKYLERRQRLLRIQKEVEKEQKLQGKLYAQYSPLNKEEAMAEGDMPGLLDKQEHKRRVDKGKIYEGWKKRHPEVSVNTSVD